MSETVHKISDDENLQLTPQHRILILALQPLWSKPSFSIDLAWMLSKNSYHRLSPEKEIEIVHDSDPSPSWLSSLDFMERNQIISYCVDNKSLLFLKNPTRYLTPKALKLPVHIAATEDAYTLYMMHWATQISFLNTQLYTCDAEEATLYYLQHEAHFLALFEFLLHQCTRGAVPDAQNTWLSPTALIPLLYRLSYTLGGHLEHVCRWLLSPMQGLALCRCVAQVLDPYLPLTSYHPAAVAMTEEERKHSDGFASISSSLFSSTTTAAAAQCSSPEQLPPHVAVPSRAFLAARVDLAIQLRVHGQYDECYSVLNNTVAHCSLPDFSDLPCTLPTYALLQLAITQQEHAEKYRNPENEREIEEALTLDLSSGSPRGGERSGGTRDSASIMALFEHVLSFCESFPRGPHQRPDVLRMQSAALLGIMTLRCQRKRDLEEDLCVRLAPEPGRLGRSTSLSARDTLAKIDEEAAKQCFEMAKKCAMAALHHPCSLHLPIESGESESSRLLLQQHPWTGEMLLQQGEMRKMVGDFRGAKDAYMQAFQLFCRYFSLPSSPDPHDFMEKKAVNTSPFSWEVMGGTRPHMLLAQACCSLGLVLDELDEITDAHLCYSNGKHIYQVLFGDGCLPAADVSVYKAMLFLNKNEVKNAQKELTEALQIYMSRFGHQHSDTLEIQSILDSVTERLHADRNHHPHPRHNVHKRSTRTTDKLSPSPSQVSTLDDAWEDCDTSHSSVSHTPSDNTPPPHSNSHLSPKRKHRKNKNKSLTPPSLHKKAASKTNDTYFNYRAQYQKYKDYHNLVSDMYHEAQCDCRCLLSSVDQTALSHQDIKFLDFDTVSYQRRIDTFVVDSFLLRIHVEQFQGKQLELDKSHTAVQECLHQALQAARQWECREIRLRQIYALGSEDENILIPGQRSRDLESMNNVENGGTDLEQGQSPNLPDVPARHEEQIHSKWLSDGNSSFAYITTPASLCIASLLMLQADHTLELFLQKSEQLVRTEDHVQQCALVKCISEQYQEAISIYKACLGDTNLMVANMLVHFASHMLSFIEYTSAQLTNVATQSNDGPTVLFSTGNNISNVIKQWFSPTDTRHGSVLPLRMAPATPAPSSSVEQPPLPDKATLELLETLHVRCQEEAEEMLEEALVLFRVLVEEGEVEEGGSCNGYDGKSSQFEVVLLPPFQVSVMRERIPGWGSGVQGGLCFTHTCALPLSVCTGNRSVFPSLCPTRTHRGDLEANVILAHVYLHREGGGTEALEHCDAHIERVQQLYCRSFSLLASQQQEEQAVGPLQSALSPLSADRLDAMRSALRMQELELLLADTELEVDPKTCSGVGGAALLHSVPPGSSGGYVHTYVAEAFVLRAHVLQTLDRLENNVRGERAGVLLSSRREEAGASLLAALLVYRRLFGDKDEQFIWLENNLNLNTPDEVAVKYEGEAYVAEGGECGTTLELAKIYNTLGSFYQEQDDILMAIEMSNRALTVLCALYLLPSTTNNVGPKIGLILCNLGDLLVQAERDEEGRQMYGMAREVFLRLDALLDTGTNGDAGISELVAMIAGSKDALSLDHETHSPPLPPPLGASAGPSWDSQAAARAHTPGVGWSSSSSRRGVPGNGGGDEGDEEGGLFWRDIRYLDDMLEVLSPPPRHVADGGNREEGRERGGWKEGNDRLGRSEEDRDADPSLEGCRLM